jgi:hypothetical protein
MVRRTRQNVVLYVRILSCYLLLAVFRADDSLYTKMVTKYGVICILDDVFIILPLVKYSRAAVTSLQTRYCITARTCNKISPDIRFIYLGNKETYCIFKTFPHNLCFIFHNMAFVFTTLLNSNWETVINTTKVYYYS